MTAKIRVLADTLFKGKAGTREGFGPDGVVNEIVPVKGGDSNQVVGDIEIGSDGFVEAMFIVDGKFVKLKRMPKNARAVLSVWRK